MTNITDPEFDLLHNILYERNNGNGQNVFDEDFTLHSSYADAVTGNAPWTCDEGYNYGALFDGECSPDGSRTRDQYSKFDWFPGKSALVLFYDMNSCVQYEASMTWILQLNLVCL